MSTFPKVKRSQFGYDIELVEDFLEDARRAYATDVESATAIDSSTIRRMSFPLKKGGYSTEHVDAALERLEEAFAQRERERGIATLGEDGWYERVRENAEEMLGRLQRPAKERFARTGSFTRGYNVEQVDAFCERLAHYFQDGPEVTPKEVRTVSFDSQRGGYDEDLVDELLDAVVNVMLAVN